MHAQLGVHHGLARVCAHTAGADWVEHGGGALRDVFPDVLKGIPMAEEVADTPAERHMGMVDEVRPAAAPAPAQALPAYADDAFAANLPKWRDLVASGRKTGDALLAMLSTKASFTEEQRAQILALKTAPAELVDDDFVRDMAVAEEGRK